MTNPPDPTCRHSEVVSLREYFEMRLIEMQRLWEAEHQALIKATEMADQANDHRLASMNEFREQLREQAGKFITRDEIKLMLDPVCEDVRSLRDSRNVLAGKASQSSVDRALVFGVIGIAIGVLGIVLQFF
jgi:hypothetical protein